MELIDIQQVKFEELSELSFDILIMVSGYENRCSFLVTHLKSVAQNKIVFGFLEKRHNGFRPENDRIYEEEHFDFHEASGNNGNDIQELLENLIQNQTKEKISVLVDYSCMTKEWYATIINYFVNWDFQLKEIDLYFSYTPSQFEKSNRKNLFNKRMQPPAVEHPGTANRPVSLILGLGYDQDQALDLVNRIRPAATYAFYSDPAQDDRFVMEVQKINREVLHNLPDSHIFRFPMNDFRRINILLKDLVIDLRLQSQVILAPLGPKPFALNCMLLSARYPDVWVWKVQTGKKELYHEWKPLGKPLICNAKFKLEEDLNWGTE